VMCQRQGRCQVGQPVQDFAMHLTSLELLSLRLVGAFQPRGRPATTQT
jgi:hypothetical protein